jgi:hypothetical protein
MCVWQLEIIFALCVAVRRDDREKNSKTINNYNVSCKQRKVMTE